MTEATRPTAAVGTSSSGPPAEADSTTNRLGKYRVTGRLGQGGMGVVYAAEDTLLKRPVALKLLPRSMADGGVAVQRFLHEARAAAQLNHVNVVHVFEIDQHNGAYFIAMELVRGGSIQDRLAARGPLPWGEATQVIADACRGLAAAHQAGLVHRDIKPANLMRTVDGVVKLADFGLAKQTDTNNTALTNTGNILGTPSYMSPEQCHGRKVDQRSDLYSLGATYFALLTGRAPYTRESSMEVMFAHCYDPIPDPRADVPVIPEGCAAVIQRAMAKDPAQRFGSATEMLAALEAVRAGTALPDKLRSAAFAPARLAAAAAAPVGVTQSDTEKVADPIAGRRRPVVTRSRAAVALVLLLLFLGLSVFYLSKNSASSASGPITEGRGPAGPGKPRVLYVLTPRGNNYNDFEAVRKGLEKRGVRLEVSSTSLDDVQMDGNARGQTVKVDVLLDNINAADYDAIVFGGGEPQSAFTGNKVNAARVRKLITDMLRAGKLVSAICGGPVVLAEAGVLHSIKATCNPSVNDVLKNKGATLVQKIGRTGDLTNEPVVAVDLTEAGRGTGYVVTGNGAGAAEPFCDELLAVIRQRNK